MDGQIKLLVIYSALVYVLHPQLIDHSGEFVFARLENQTKENLESETYVSRNGRSCTGIGT